MGESEREKMASGQWYSCLDPELDRLRIAARTAVHRHNTLPPDERGAAAPDLIPCLPASAPMPSSRRRSIAPMASISPSARPSISMPAA